MAEAADVGGPVFLVGMMASGKTTVGRRLAAHTGASFCDLDVRIARMTGRSIPALLAAGEPAFRTAERIALRSLVDEPGFAGGRAVVATGGGTVMDPANRAAMRRVGTVVLLEVPLHVLAARTEHDDGGRPLLAGADRDATLLRLWAERESAYREGAVVVSGDAEPEAVVESILRQLAAVGPP